MGTSFVPYLLALDPPPSDITVVITGLLLVFLILILLTLIITVEGKVFDALAAKKKAEKAAPAPSAPAPAAKPAGGGSVSAAAVLPAPGAVAPEVVAVIAAAVASMEQGASFTIRSIKPVSRAAQASGRKAWGQAGVQSNTAPF